jgi:Holliday junction resolvase-like predicted endonuclease
MRTSPASKKMNTEDREATALEAVTRRQPVKIWQTQEVFVRDVVNCRVCKLAIAL